MTIFGAVGRFLSGRLIDRTVPMHPLQISKVKCVKESVMNSQILQNYCTKLGEQTRLNVKLKNFETLLKPKAKPQCVPRRCLTTMQRASARKSFHAAQYARGKLKQFRTSLPNSAQLCGVHAQLQGAAREFLALILRQSNPIVAQRVRRGTQITKLYADLGYDKHSFGQMLDKLGKSVIRRIRRARKHDRPLFALFSSAAAFNWEENRIKQSEMLEVSSEMRMFQHPDSPPPENSSNDDDRNNNGPSGDTNNGYKQNSSPDMSKMRINSDALVGWERVMNEEHIVAYRRPLSESHLFEYKVFGSFLDLPARAFYNAQLDFEFRKKWDKLVVKLDVIERDPASGTELVHWITHFPYPMYQREYVYVRRYHVDEDEKMMTIVSRHSEHPALPVTSKYVRVADYMSNMVIKPHGDSFDENGFDYVLTYHDDPQANIPTMCYKWVASKGVPKFINDLHDAAIRLHEKFTAANEKDPDKFS